MRDRGAAGFTLIELLIGVAIIAILGAIAIPHVVHAHRQARYARAASETKTIATQMVAYANDRNVYPLDVATLQAARYATVSPIDPWGHPYQLIVNGAAPVALPQKTDNVVACSFGWDGVNTCMVDAATGRPTTPIGGSVGYSSVYGSWSGS